MHAVLRHEGSTSQPHAAPRARTVLWLLPSELDCDAYTLWTHSRLPCDGCEAYADLDKALRRCESYRPRILVLDPTINENAVARGVAALHAKTVGHLLLLDGRPFEGRLVDLLAEPRVSYISRTAGSQTLIGAVDVIFNHDARTFDPAIANRLRPTPRGYEFHERPGVFSVVDLSYRERQVMRLLALGKTVAECAAALGLAHSTIDNHKARLMKKLGIHKASELTCRAIRDGLIVL